MIKKICVFDYPLDPIVLITSSNKVAKYMTSHSVALGYRLDIPNWDPFAHFELIVRFRPTSRGIKNQQTCSGN